MHLFNFNGISVHLWLFCTKMWDLDVLFVYIYIELQVLSIPVLLFACS